MTIEIPSPPSKPIVGHLPQVFGNETIQKLVRLCETFDGIYSLRLPGSKFYVVYSHQLVNEICDERKFRKTVEGALAEIRNVAGDGLFTARKEEPNWSKAHNILMPGFGMKSMVSYVETMTDVARELVAKWYNIQN